MSDRICLEDVRLNLHIGARIEEREVPQPVRLDMQMTYDTRAAAKSGNLSDTLNYETVFQKIQEMIALRRYILLETFCEQVAEIALGMGASSVWVKATKLQCAIAGFEGLVSVEIERPTVP